MHLCVFVCVCVCVCVYINVGMYVCISACQCVCGAHVCECIMHMSTYVKDLLHFMCLHKCV